MKTKSFWSSSFFFTLRLFSITIVALTAMSVLEVPTNLSFIQAIGGSMLFLLAGMGLYPLYIPNKK